MNHPKDQRLCLVLQGLCVYMSYCIYDVGMLSDVLHVLLVFRSLGSHVFVEFPHIVQVSKFRV